MRQITFWTRLAWFEPLWIVILASSLLLPGHFWPLNWQPILVLLLFLFWPLRWLAYGRLSIRTPVDWPLALLLFWLPFSMWISVELFHSWVVAGYLLLGVTFYSALINWPPTQNRPEIIAWVVGLIGLGLIFLAPLMVASATQPMRSLRLDRYQTLLSDQLGETINPNIWAGSLLLILPIYWSLTLAPRWSRHWWPRLLVGLIALLATGALLLAESRGAYLGLAVVLAAVILLRWPRTLYLFIRITVAALFWLARGGVFSFLDYMLADPTLYGWSGRPEIWLRGYSAIQDFPWSGVELGMYARAIPELYPYFTMDYSIFTRDYRIPHAHNLWLQIGVDMGAPGIIAYTAFILGVFVMLIRPIRAISLPVLDPRRVALYQALAVGICAGLIGMLVHGLLDAATWGVKLAFIPWLLYAMATNLHRRFRQ